MKLELKTDRLILKVLPSDCADIVLDFYKANSDIFEKYEPLLGEDFYTISHHQNILRYEYQNMLKLSMVRYFIFEKDNPNKVIGTLSFRNITRNIYSCCTLGYKMDHNYWRIGYCYEAIDAAMQSIISEMGIHRIEALVMPSNEPSIGLLEKLGFEREGLLRDKICLNNKREDHYMYAYIANN